jgi:RHS repeat-associated protein
LNTKVWRNLPTTEPFGNSPPETDPNSTGTSFHFNLRFPGQYADSETNTNYNGFRDYNPSTGGYSESDPIGLGGGQASTYTYVNGNPLRRIDPLGLANGPNANPTFQPSKGPVPPESAALLVATFAAPFAVEASMPTVLGHLGPEVLEGANNVMQAVLESVSGIEGPPEMTWPSIATATALDFEHTVELIQGNASAIVDSAQNGLNHIMQNVQSAFNNGQVGTCPAHN